MVKPEKHVSIKEEPEIHQEVDDSKQSSSHVGRWDTEEDHLLSYFLEDGSTLRHRSGSSDAAADASSATPAELHPRPPTTPAVQFYAHHSHKQQQQQPEESLSMTSMAAALVSGGPLVPPQTAEESKENTDLNTTTDSPISPAAIIGTGQENLLLPPPGGTEHSQAEKQQHLAWLNHINAMAVMSRQQQQQQQAAMQPQPQMHMHVGGMPPPAMYTTAAAAAAAVVGTGSGGPPPRAPSAVETEERRARRLARNRESARQSRRRKKEKLATLERQVTDLFAQVERERKSKLMEMEPKLQELRTTMLQQQQQMTSNTTSQQELQQLLQATAPNCLLRERVASFQYAHLRQLLLPRHCEFLLWLTARNDEFFTQAKQVRLSEKNSSGRVSSKQIGEELTHEFSSKEQQEESSEEKKFVSSSADDALRMWPLLCFELGISVDQEERLVQTQKRVQDISTLPEDRMQMALATKMATNMKKGVLFQGHAAAMRTDTTLLEILTPQQSVKFLTWMSANRDRVRERMQQRNDNFLQETESEARTLSDLCQRLERVLRLPEESG